MFGLSRFPQITTLALVGMAVFQLGCPCSPPYEGEYSEGDRPGKLKDVKFKESDKGDPKIIGCADGQREAFADVTKHPRIAGCMAAWPKRKKIRSKGDGKACGDDGAECSNPGSACAEGWHICAHEGNTKDLKDRVSPEDCHNAGPGRFNAGISHGQTDELCPPPPKPSTKFPCTQAGIGSEPVCCGNDCQFGKCKNGVWSGKTKISRGTEEGCGSVTSEHNGGVLCCYDGDDAPKAGGSAEAPKDEAPAAGSGGEAPVGEKVDAKAEKGDAKDDAKAKKTEAK